MLRIWTEERPETLAVTSMTPSCEVRKGRIEGRCRKIRMLGGT
jgi:hypothetical protein